MSTATGIGAGGTGQPTAPGARIALGLQIGTDVQAWDAGLDALAAFNTNGFIVQTANDTYAGRTITGTAAEVTVTNGDGVSGNPVISLPAALTFTGKTITGGTYASGAFNGTVGATTPSTGSFTTLSASGTSTLATTNINGLNTTRAGTSGTQSLLQTWGYPTNNVIWSLILEGAAANQLSFYSYDETTGTLISAPLILSQNGTVTSGGDIASNGAIAAVGNITTTGSIGTGVAGAYFVGADAVVGARNTGWAADSGTATKTSTATYTAVSFGATYNATVQGQLNTLSTAVQAATRSIKAIKDALIAHGLIGA